MARTLGKLPPKPEAPRFVCGRCPHSSQWHQQSQRTQRDGYRSFEGASCHFDGCDCPGYAAKRAPA